MRLQLFILLSIVSSSVFSKPIYLRYESLSMDRYEYKMKDDNQLNIPYFIYCANINDDSKWIFRTGLEKNEYQQNFSGELINLDQLAKSVSETNTIFSIAKDLYIVKQEKYGFNVSKVLEINQLIVQNDVINYISPSINFTYHQQVEKNVNLASDDSDYEVYYTDANKSGCMNYLHFRLVDKMNMTTAKGMIINSYFGVAQQSLKGNNEIELIKINNVPFDTYERAFCNHEDLHRLSIAYQPILKEDISIDNSPTTEELNTSMAINNTIKINSTEVLTEKKGSEVKQDVVLSNLKSMENSAKDKLQEPKVQDTKLVNDPSNPCPPSSNAGIHIVQEGESLYAISKKLGLTVAQLRSWNNLTPDLILRPCMSLVLNEPKNNKSNLKSAEIFTEKGGATIESLPEWKKNTTGVHIVKSNENLDQIAAKYGFTTERFKLINKLENNNLAVGQELKTSDCVCPTPNDRKVEPINEVKTEVIEKIEAKESNKLEKTENLPTTEIKILTKSTTDTKIKSVKKVAKTKYYTVKEDDTLISIAKKFKMTIEKIRELNNLDEKDTIVPFQKIIIE